MNREVKENDRQKFEQRLRYILYRKKSLLECVKKKKKQIIDIHSFSGIMLVIYTFYDKFPAFWVFFGLYKLNLY